MIGPIFIGGAGRSGTTLLNRLVGRHRQVFSFDHETRFIVDPDGIIFLLDALTTRYSAANAREALRRFERLVRVELTTPKRHPYFGYDLTTSIEPAFLQERTDRYVASLVYGSFAGHDAPDVPVSMGPIARAVWRRKNRENERHTGGASLKLVRFQPDRERILSTTSSYIDDLFTHAANARGKEAWCEKTPSNFLHFDFLHELFEGVVLVHVKRDPRGVVSSMRRKPWAPGDVHGACHYLQSIYERWFQVREHLEANSVRWIEVKLEELCEAPIGVLSSIFAIAGIEPDVRDEMIQDVSRQRATRWESTIDARDRIIIETLLGDHIKRLGYEV